MLARVSKKISTQGLTVSLTDEAKDFLVEKGFDPHYGARPLQRSIQRLLEDPLAEDILVQKGVPRHDPFLSAGGAVSACRRAHAGQAGCFGFHHESAPGFHVGGMGGAASGFSFSALQKIPLHRLTWTGGEVRVDKSSSTPALVLTAASGDLRLTPRSISLKARADGADGTIRLEMHGARSLLGPPRLDLKTTLDASSLSLAAVSEKIGDRWGKADGKLSGTLVAAWEKIDLDSAPVQLADFVNRARWTGDVRVDGLWTPPGAGPKDRGVPVKGKVKVNNEGVEQIDLRFFQTLSVSGSVRWPAGEANLRWEGKSVPLAELAQSGLRFFRSVPDRGTLDTAGEFTGTAAAPLCSWTARVRGTGVTGLSIPEFSVQGTWDKNQLFVSAKGMGGTVEFIRDGAVLRRPRWRGTASGLDLGVLADQNGWRRVGGTLDASFSMVLGDKPGLFPEAEGKLRLDRFTWAGHRETAPVEGLFQMGPSGARLKGMGGLFDVDIAEQSNQWRVERFHYESGVLKLSAQGFLKDAEGNIGLEARVDGVPLSSFPFLTKRVPDVEGRLSLSGRVQGLWGDPWVAGRFFADDIRWRSGGLLHRAQGHWRGGKSGITLSDATWDDSVRAEGTWLFGKGGQLTAELQRTAAETLFDFWPDTGTLAGIVSGGVSVRAGSDNKPHGWARFTVEQGRANQFNFESLRTVAFIRGDTAELETLSLRTKGGTFDCRGSLKKRDGSNPNDTLWDWEGAGFLDHFFGERVPLSSSWTARGTWWPARQEGRGVWSSPSVVVGGSAPLDAGAVRAAVSWNPEKIRLDDAVVQRGLRGAASVSRIDGRVAGQFQMKDLSVPALFPNTDLFQGREEARGSLVLGPVNGEVTLGGTWKQPTAKGRFTLAQSRWKEMSFVGEARAAWDRVLDVTGAEIRFKEGGVLDVVGRWDPGPIPQTRLTARLTETPLTPLLTSLGIPAGRGGVAHGDLSLAGPRGAMEGTAAFFATGVGSEEEPMDLTGRLRVTGSSVTVNEALLTTSEGRLRVRPGGWAAFQDNGVCVFRADPPMSAICARARFGYSAGPDWTDPTMSKLRPWREHLGPTGCGSISTCSTAIWPGLILTGRLLRLKRSPGRRPF
jgi:hypothetical protein